jgi:hypothetical protein
MGCLAARLAAWMRSKLEASADTPLEELRARLLSIERSIEAGNYRPGPWTSLMRTVRALPRDQRIAIASDVARVSRRLHLLNRRKTISVGIAIALELGATVIGAGLLVIGWRLDSNALAIACALIWATTFEPLLKFVCGHIAGMHYDYAYLFGIEPRFKINYGSYLAASRATRVAFHLSGTVGSPLAAWLVYYLLPSHMKAARIFCGWALAVLIGINALALVMGIAGVRRIGQWRLEDASGGAAGAELREAIGLRA